MNNCYRGYILIAFWVCSLAVYGQTEMQAIDTLRNIRLQEVIVTATQSDAPGTRSVIGQDAIRHIQATDLSVLSQLLPGVLVRNNGIVPVWVSNFALSSLIVDRTHIAESHFTAHAKSSFSTLLALTCVL